MSSKELILIECVNCKVKFERSRKQIVNNEKRGRLNCCSKSCSSQYKNQKNKQGSEIVECLNCSNKFQKKVSQIKKTKNNFCCRRCAATYNNKNSPKRRISKSYSCFGCSVKLKLNRKYCVNCSEQRLLGNKRLEEVLMKSGSACGKYRRVHGHAKTMKARENLDRVCSNCGYSKHVELCHIKPISSFPLDSLLSEINDLSNLIFLCPNCHWELDHNL